VTENHRQTYDSEINARTVFKNRKNPGTVVDSDGTVPENQISAFTSLFFFLPFFGLVNS
jgi:hypothetical protein